MFDASSNTIVGLEIGTSKVCAVIADASGGGAPLAAGSKVCGVLCEANAQFSA